MRSGTSTARRTRGGRNDNRFKDSADRLHIEGDTETVQRFLNGRLREVYMHRCRKYLEREDAGAVHEECFERRAETERIASGVDKPVDRTDGLIQGELF